MHAPKSPCTSRPKTFRRITRRSLPVDTADLAHALIGHVLVRDAPEGRTAGRIVEVEAYVLGDPASHAFRGMTMRNAPMFLEAHRAYVYRIYGTSSCVNVTSEKNGCGAAVLIRALEPIEGLDLMERRRATARVRDLCRGPGRLCQALAIGMSLNGVDLVRGAELWIARPVSPASVVGSSVRIGITRAMGRRLRFYEAQSAYLSGPKSLSPA